MYEYTIREFDGADPNVILARLNEHGEAGWEAFYEEHEGALHRVWLRRQTSNIAGGLSEQTPMASARPAR
jgi:hypothetical protein